MSTTPTTLVLAPPLVRGDRVVFQWTSAQPIDGLRSSSFMLHYPGLDLTPFSRMLWLEIAIAFLVKPLGETTRPARIVLPSPIPEPVAAFWRAFHDAPLVDITPVSSLPAYDPAPGLVPSRTPRYRHAIFYGGGKDSLLAAMQLDHIVGARDTLLVNFTKPTGRRVPLDIVSRNQRETLLDPVRERYGFGTAQVLTDYQTIFERSDYPGLPHIELYTVGALPLLISNGVRLATFTYGRNCYRAAPVSGPPQSWTFRRSRREILAAQTAHYHQRLGLDLSIENAGDLLTNYSAYHVLARRYPDALPLSLSCVKPSPERRTCNGCRKCVLAALLALCHGLPDQAVDVDATLAAAPTVLAAVAMAEAAMVASTGANLPYHRDLNGIDEANFLRAVALADDTLARRHLSDAALSNLLILKSAWGNDPRDDSLSISRASMAGVRSPVLRAANDLLAEHLPLVDRIEGPYSATTRHAIDDTMPLHPHLAQLVAAEG